MDEPIPLVPFFDDVPFPKMALKVLNWNGVTFQSPTYPAVWDGLELKGHCQHESINCDDLDADHMKSCGCGIYGVFDGGYSSYRHSYGWNHNAKRDGTPIVVSIESVGRFTVEAHCGIKCSHARINGIVVDDADIDHVHEREKMAESLGLPLYIVKDWWEESGANKWNAHTEQRSWLSRMSEEWEEAVKRMAEKLDVQKWERYKRAQAKEFQLMMDYLDGKLVKKGGRHGR